MGIATVEETSQDVELLTTFVVREPEATKLEPAIPYLELEKAHEAAILRQRLIDGFILAGLIYGLLQDSF